MPEQREKLGALWAKHKSGAPADRPFFTGNVTINGETTRIVVMANGFKKEDKHPDLIVYLDTYTPGQRAEQM